MATKSRHSINWGQAFAEVLLIFIGVAVALLADRWGDYRAIVAEGFDQWNQLQVPFLVAEARGASVYSTGYMGVEFPGASVPIERRAFWSAEFESILAVSVISRQDMIYVREQVLASTDEILDLIDGVLGPE